MKEDTDLSSLGPTTIQVTLVGTAAVSVAPEEKVEFVEDLPAAGDVEELLDLRILEGLFKDAQVPHKPAVLNAM